MCKQDGRGADRNNNTQPAEHLPRGGGTHSQEESTRTSPQLAYAT